MNSKESLFLIPSYQRGYRWTTRQVRALLNDLLEFRLKDKGELQFYCLQPIIVGKTTLNDTEYGPYNGKEAWEVIDGQQRLTTIYILLRYLNTSLNPTPSCYKIIYETRKEDIEFLEKLGKDSIPLNIDAEHMKSTYDIINDWFNTEKEYGAYAMLKRFGDEDRYDELPDLMRKLFSITKLREDTPKAVKVIWYEITPGISVEAKKAIREFLKINTGNIKLTDAELIKALFLQKRTSHSEDVVLQQNRMALQWEEIENTLHNNGIWSFLSNDREQEDSRISLLLELVYRNKTGKTEPLGYAELFDYYYNEFERLSHESDPTAAIQKLWNEEIMEAYRTIKDWFADPYLYNYVGLLVKRGVMFRDVYELHTSSSTKSEFISKLKENEREWLNAILSDNKKYFKKPSPLTPDDSSSLIDYLNLQYKSDKPRIIHIMHLVNVMQYVAQIDEMKKFLALPDAEKKKCDSTRSERELMSAIYRFPFDVLDAQMWDVEHVDSATTNEMVKKEEQKNWVVTTMANNLDLFGNKDLNEAIKSENWKDAILRIRELKGETENEEEKDWIGNLVLLDAGTNRSYHNDLFCDKKTFITSRIHKGFFVPPFTRLVFGKEIEGCDKTMPANWTLEDKVAYHNALLNEIRKFIASK